MKKILAILIILSLSVSFVYASSEKLFETDKLSMEKFLNISNIYDLTLTDSFASVITTSKLVKTTGFNNHYQLGNAMSGDSDFLVDVNGITSVIKVVGGEDFAVALTQAGKVYVWGKNDRGQLGLGDTENRAVPVSIASLSSIMDIAAGDDFVVAVKYDGSVWSWGANDYGQLGLGDKIDRLVPTRIENILTTAAVYAGNSHVAALAGTAKIYVWGKNDFGQLGLGNTDECLVPTIAPEFQSALDYAFGDDFSAVVKGSGIVYVCGRNDYGQLGLGHTNAVTTLTEIPTLRSIYKVEAGKDHMAALSFSGVPYTWGRNDYGQLGSGNYEDKYVPEKVQAPSTFTDLKCGGYSTAFVAAAGPVYFMGNLVKSKETVNEEKPVVRPSKPASIKDIGILIDNKWFVTDVEPVIINDRTMLPMRAIFEEYGATLDWNDSSKTAIATLGNTTVSVAIGGKIAYVNNQPVELDSPAVIVNSRTLVPVRFISEALGFKVDWDGENRVVIITR